MGGVLTGTPLWKRVHGKGLSSVMMWNEEKPLPVLIVTGPTASGKSIFAAEIGKSLGGEIVNCDSMQIYDGLPILTNQPSDELKANVPHHLFSILDPCRDISHAEIWLRKAADVINTIHAKGRIPIICGGTGLYIQTLLYGISPIPDIPEEIRNGVRLRLIHEGVQTLHRSLVKLDPSAAACVQPCDSVRIARALEVYLATGRSIVEWQKDPPLHLLPHHKMYTLLIAPSRQIRHERTDERTVAMFQEGIAEEVENANVEEWRADSPLHKAIGLNILLRYLEGSLKLEDALQNIATKTKQYGKRQMTWFRHHLHPDVMLNDEECPGQKQQIARLMQQILSHSS